MKISNLFLSTLLLLAPIFGHSLPIDLDDPNFIGKGIMKGNVTFIELPKELVESWLPEGLLLADQKWTGDDTYPVGLLIMEQQNVFFGYPDQPDSSHNYSLGTYLETIVWAPFIKVDPEVYPELNPKTIYSHMLKLYLTAEDGLDFGINYYGINKYLANMEYRLNKKGWNSNHSYEISAGNLPAPLKLNYTTKPLKTLKFKNVGLLVKMQKALNHPYIFKHPKQDEIICAKVRWNYLRGIVSAADTHLEINEGFMPGLEPQVISSEKNKPMASYYIRIPWKFSGPQTCK